MSARLFRRKRGPSQQGLHELFRRVMLRSFPFQTPLGQQPCALERDFLRGVSNMKTADARPRVVITPQVFLFILALSTMIVVFSGCTRGPAESNVNLNVNTNLNRSEEHTSELQSHSF